jgi:integrase
MKFTKTFFGRPSTVRVYTSLFTHWIEPHLDDSKLNPNSIYFFLTLWKDADLNPRTIKILTRLFKWYLEFHKINTSHFRQISRNIARDCKSKPVNGLNKEQSKLLLNTCKKLDSNFYPFLLLGLHTGMRRGEILGLQFGDIDFLRGYITVSRSYNGPTKSGLSRKIPISAELEETLLNTYNFNMRERERLFSTTDPNPVLEYLCNKANIPRITAHGLRHTFATLALESGMSPRKVQEILGHTKMSTTLDYYWDNIHEKVDLSFLS